MRAFSTELRGLNYSTYWGFDSFTGLPSEHVSVRRTQTSRDLWQPGAFNASRSYTPREIEEYIGEPRARIVRGYFEETLTDALAKRMRMQPALLVEMDSDLYVSTKLALEFLLRNGLVMRGTVIGYDDWGVGGDTGEQRAHRETRDRWKLRFRRVTGEEGRTKARLERRNKYHVFEVV